MNFAKLLFFLVFYTCFCPAQNQYKKWYFGYKAGIDFMNGPPTPLPASAMTVLEGCASIADQNGNLLFYTDGSNVWNQAHVTMANGNSINSGGSSSQHALIVKKPSSSNIYYVFSLEPGNNSAFRYSIVDMNLSAGMGSVTVKSVVLLPNLESSSTLTGTKHCNGQDFWILTRSQTSATFYAFLLSSAGLNTMAVVSSLGTDSIYPGSTMKISPNGKKLALNTSTWNASSLSVTVYDFDISSGTVLSNLVVLTGFPVNPAGPYPGLPYGLEFSPDGSKLYVSQTVSGSSPAFPQLCQFDLCAGNAQAINTSKYIVSYGSATSSTGGALQLGPNGKIYKAKTGYSVIDVINNPDLTGAACNFISGGQQLLPPSTSFAGLPNFITSDLKVPQAPPQFSYTVKCRNATFTQLSGNSCSAMTYAPLANTWDFGDPASGNNNNSTATNPTHFYSAIGSYTVKLIVNYLCRADTVIQQVTISSSGPMFSLSGKTNICKNQTSTLTAVLSASQGALSYTWAPSNLTTTLVSVSPSMTTVYTVTGQDANGCTATNTIQLTVNPCTGIDEIFSGEPVLYPNPTTGLVSIRFPENTDYTILNLVDLFGRTLMRLTIPDRKQTTIDLSALENGVYFLEYNGERNKSVVKIVKN